MLSSSTFTVGSPRKPSVRPEVCSVIIARGEVVDLVRAQLVALPHLDNARFDPATRFGLPTLDRDGTLIRAGHPVDVTRKGLPTDTEGPCRSGTAAPSTGTTC